MHAAAVPTALPDPAATEDVEQDAMVVETSVETNAVDVPFVAQPAHMDHVEETQVWTAHRALRRARVRALPSEQADTVGFVHAEQMVQGHVVFSGGRRWLRVDLQAIDALAVGAAFVLAEYADGEVIIAPVAGEHEVG